ncbi:MAG: DNA repair protein RadA [Bacillota bacterium]
MAKPKKYYKCTECGYKSTNWMGKCSSCGNWNTFVEFIEEKSKVSNRKISKDITVKPLTEKSLDIEEERISINIKEVDRVLGGGLVKGSLVLLGGEPGIGKSTLTLQIAKELAKNNKKVLYISGEESINQISIRAKRLKAFNDNIFIMSITDINSIYRHLNDKNYDLIIADSIQTIYDSEYDSSPGSTVQIREVTSSFMSFAKEENVPVIIIGHVTKKGQIAGPKLMEHMVDTVLYLSGESNNYRLLKSHKNRFGSVEEVGVFSMESNGLGEVANPSNLFLRERPINASGSTVVPISEGNRVILVELQALVASSNFGNPQRIASGIDRGRANLILAVLEKRLGLNLSERDVHFNIVGGLKVKEPALDLALAAAIISSYLDYNIPSDTVFFGEIGLSGEVRSVQGYKNRIGEAKKLDFKKIVLPKGNKNNDFSEKINLYPIANVNELFNLIKNTF